MTTELLLTVICAFGPEEMIGNEGEKGKKRQVEEDINRRGRRDRVDGRDNLGYPKT